MQSHFWSILTNPYSSKITQTRYCDHFYDMITNQSENHKDTIFILNRVLTVSSDKVGRLGIRVKVDSSPL